MSPESNTEKDRVVYHLLENALDFVLYAAEHVKQDSPRSWKYALLHLISGIELLLKSRLEMEHWSLLFQEVDKASESAFDSGDFRSVDFDSLIQRLSNISGVSIEQQQRQHLLALRKLRNQLEHFAINIELTQLKALMAKGLSFVIAFYEGHLKEEIEAENEDIITDIINHLREFEEFVKERLDYIAPSLEDVYLLRECPRCFQDTMECDINALLNCHFCGFEIAAEDLARERSEFEVDICPDCGNRALAFIIYNNESAGWECFACGTEYDELHRCDSCNELYPGEGPMCSDCYNAMIEHDD